MSIADMSESAIPQTTMSLLGAFGSVGGLSATPFILYAILAVFTGILLINIKGLPGFWHVCFLEVGGYDYFVADLPVVSHSRYGFSKGSQHSFSMPNGGISTVITTVPLPPASPMPHHPTLTSRMAFPNYSPI